MRIHPKFFLYEIFLLDFFRALFAKKLFSIFLEVQHKKVKYNGSTVPEKVLLSHLNGECTLRKPWTNLNERRVNSVWTQNRIRQTICLTVSKRNTWSGVQTRAQSEQWMQDERSIWKASCVFLFFNTSLIN